jgi:hypothetical protein
MLNARVPLTLEVRGTLVSIELPQSAMAEVVKNQIGQVGQQRGLLRYEPRVMGEA